MTRNIDDQIRTYYMQQALSIDALGRLLDLSEQTAKPSARTLHVWQSLAVAATVAIAFLAGALFVAKSPTSSPSLVESAASGAISNRIATEVAMRHHNCKHVDFTANELAGLAASMTNLDFTLAVPDGVDLSRLTLQGGHYCVVNGQLALHATFIDPSGNTVSLLETRTSPQLASMKYVMHEIDGVEVEMWQKNDIIIAMARPVAGLS